MHFAPILFLATNGNKFLHVSRAKFILIIVCILIWMRGKSPLPNLKYKEKIHCEMSSSDLLDYIYKYANSILLWRYAHMKKAV